MRMLLLLFILASVTASAQLSKKDSLWLPLAGLIGEWKGNGTGVDGDGSYERSYRFALNKNYIEVRNKTIYGPTANNAKGYTHEDVGYISYDKQRKTFVFRQFHSEGFVNQYRLDSVSADKKTLVFISEGIENIPNGWRAKERYVLTEGKLTEEFELAEPGKPFAPYTNARLIKKE